MPDTLHLISILETIIIRKYITIKQFTISILYRLDSAFQWISRAKYLLR